MLEVEEITSMLPKESRFLFNTTARNEGNTYIVYRLIEEVPGFKTAEGEIITNYTIQIDLNSDKRDLNYRKLIKKIKELAKMAGWEKGAIFEDRETKEQEKIDIFFICLRYHFSLITGGVN